MRDNQEFKLLRICFRGKKQTKNNYVAWYPFSN